MDLKMSRVPLFDPTNMNAEQARVYNNIVEGPRGQLVGPLRAVLHRADLADNWQQFGESLRFGTSLPRKLVELAIIVTGRRWNSQVEWHVHSLEALKAGLSAEAVEAIRLGTSPALADADEVDTYEFARQLQMTGNVEDALYARLQARLGVIGIVELSSVIGYYTLVSMTLNVHNIPLPDTAITPPLSCGEGLTSLPPACLAQHSQAG
jgi:4-carboxymuconolactone decarboxylase